MAKGIKKLKLASGHEVLLRLVKEDGDVHVMAVDSDGNRVCAGYLIRFNQDGTINHQRSVDSSIGFYLDYEGRISIRNK